MNPRRGGALHDVVVIGDGPAGSAMASACSDVGLDIVAVGSGDPWRHTLSSWVDDVPQLPSHVFGAIRDDVRVGGGDERRVPRAYGTFDNAALRAHLGIDRVLRKGSMERITRCVVEGRELATVVLSDGQSVSARCVVDATGASADAPPAWQSAYGVFVDEATAVRYVPTETVTLMEWWGDGDVPMFRYAVPVADRWLLEATVLASGAVVDSARLRARLVDWLGETVVVDAESTGAVEIVQIPMGSHVRRGSGCVVPFGAAAGMIHPATGYSVAAALRAAPRVAQAIARGDDVHEAVWPTSARRARVLHDYGLRAVLRLEPSEVDEFFDAFFDLDVAVWSDYLRIDTTPRAVARAMGGVFRRVPWSVRRKLVDVDLGVVRELRRA